MARAPDIFALTSLPDIEIRQGGQGKVLSPGPSQARLAAMGYVEREYVIRGVSVSFPESKNSEITAGPRAAYATRILLRVPARTDQFNGAAVVEWLDSTDAAPEWTHTQIELVRGGFAWAGVSLEPAEQYADLRHPGDQYSYDMFSHAGRAVRSLLPGAKLIAAGMAGSASRLTTYVDRIDPISEVFDGYLIHCPPENTATRSVRVPVLVLQTETEVACPGYGSADAECSWEIAGAAQIDGYVQAMAGLDPVRHRPADIITALAGQPAISSPQHHYVASAALHHLHRRIRDGIALPPGDRLATLPGAPHILKRDAYGNAVGGIRTPWMDVPTALLTGVGQQTVVPFPPAMLRNLYPSVEVYQNAFDAATETAVENGFILRADVAEIKEIAAITYVMSLHN